MPEIACPRSKPDPADAGVAPVLPILSRAEAEIVLRGMQTLEEQLHAAEQLKDWHIQQHQAKLIIPAILLGSIQHLQGNLLESTARLEEWAKGNRKAEFDGKQSLELVAGGCLRFRLGNRSLALLSGWTWPRVKKKMLAGGRAWGRFIRRVPEIDKQKILAATSPNTSDETGFDHKAKTYRYASALEVKLRKIGLRVAQEETFTVELEQPQGDVAPDAKGLKSRYSITEPLDADVE